MRKLQTSDIFNTLRLIKKANLRGGNQAHTQDGIKRTNEG